MFRIISIKVNFFKSKVIEFHAKYPIVFYSTTLLTIGYLDPTLSDTFSQNISEINEVLRNNNAELLEHIEELKEQLNCLENTKKSLINRNSISLKKLVGVCLGLLVSACFFFKYYYLGDK